MKQKTIFLTFVFIGLITMALAACHPAAEVLNPGIVLKKERRKHWMRELKVGL